MFHALQLEPVDNVATVVTEVGKGTLLTIRTPAETITSRRSSRSPFGHKIALTAIEKGRSRKKLWAPNWPGNREYSKGRLGGRTH